MIYGIQNGEEVLNANGCVGTRLYEASGNEYVHLAIAPGGSIPEHALPLAVSFCVLKGGGTCAIEGRAMDLTAGQMAECPPNAQRSWANKTDAPLEILVIKRAAGN